MSGRTVCVFCSSSTRIAAAHAQLAADVGRGIAERGWTLVSGGGSVSMMGAVARAAREAGGRTVGVLPRSLADAEVADADAAELIVTADLRSRKAEMERRSDAFLALPGGIGTLEELFEVWTARSLGLHRKPVVVCDPAGVLGPLRALLADLTAQGFVRAEAADCLDWTTGVAEALDRCAAPPAAPPQAPAEDVLEDVGERSGSAGS